MIERFNLPQVLLVLDLQLVEVDVVQRLSCFLLRAGLPFRAGDLSASEQRFEKRVGGGVSREGGQRKGGGKTTPKKRARRRKILKARWGEDGERQLFNVTCAFRD